MKLEKKIEEKIQKTEKKLLELLLKMQRLDAMHAEIMAQLGTSPEELRKHVEEPSNFAPEVWAYFQEEKRKMDERLELDLKNIPDLEKTKKAFSDCGRIQPHWLFVR